MGRDFYYGCGVSAMEQKYRSAVTQRGFFRGKKKTTLSVCAKEVKSLRVK